MRYHFRLIQKAFRGLLTVVVVLVVVLVVVATPEVAVVLAVVVVVVVLPPEGVPVPVPVPTKWLKRNLIVIKRKEGQLIYVEILILGFEECWRFLTWLCHLFFLIQPCFKF